MALSFKTKISVLSILLCVLLLANCGQANKNELGLNSKIADSLNCAKTPLNPNGDSELALLMRAMMKNSDSLRTLVMQGKLPKNFPEAFLKIHSAKPTDSDTKKESFNAYADNYILTLHKFFQSSKEDLTENYNSVVNACANCHSEHCPGPLKAINKLKLN